MRPRRADGLPASAAPSFRVIERKPPRPAAIVFAMLIAGGVLFMTALGLGHNRARRFSDAGTSAARSPGATGEAGASAGKDEDDDPSQIDTIVLGDAGDAPVPARRKDRVSDVHATIIVHLPRFGQQAGLIPDSPAGHLLYGWLAAFNQASDPALQQALPNVAPAFTAGAQMQLRQQTGGFELLSAKEVQPGVLVFRLRDQTPLATETLGTLQVRPNSKPAAIASFSLRAVVPAGKQATTGVPATSP